MTSATPTGAGSARPAVWLWARREVANRWRSLVALGVLAGLTGGLCLAAVAGARRTGTARERFREATAAPDALVFATQLAIHDADYAPVRALPEVLDAGEFVLAPVGIEEWDIGTLAPGDAQLYETIARPLLIAGRLADPTRPDEIVVNRKAASQFGVHLGDKVTIVSSTDQSAFFGSDVPLDGPSTQATVVGIGDSEMDLIFGDGDPGFVPSWAFLESNPGIPRPPNLVVRLRPGTDVAAFRVRAAAAMNLPDLPVRDLTYDNKRVTHGTDLERNGLLLFALAVAVAGTVLVGQALTRTVYAGADDAAVLRSLGLDRPNQVSALVLPTLLAAVLGGVAALVVAVGLSPRLPIGLAGRLDPDKGVHADWSVLAPGGAALIGLMVLGAFLAARRTTAAPRPARVRSRPSRALAAVRRIGPLPAVIGAGLALDRGRGRRALPVRPALAGVTAGVLGIVGAFGLVRGIDDALAEPARSGQTWHAQFDIDEQHLPDVLGPALSADPSVEAVSIIPRVNVDIRGAGIPIYFIDEVEKGFTFAVLDGRRPAGPGEVVLGPDTARQLHVGIGDTIGLGGDGPQAKVVGLALLPQTPHSSYDQGAWVTPEMFAGLLGGHAMDVTSGVMAVKFRPGVAVDAKIGELSRTLGVFGETSTLPQDVVLLGNVRTLPRAFAAFLAVLGVGALAHALTTTVRRRRHDLAVLRALGFRPRQVAACIAWQATTVAVLALVIGIPLGIAAGERVWQWVADSAPLVVVPAVAVAVVALAAPVTLLLANLVATLPARQAARIRPAEVLRTAD